MKFPAVPLKLIDTHAIRCWLVALFALFMLGGCVTVPQATLVISNNPDISPSENCVAPPEPGMDLPGLKTDSISLVSWNIYKQQRPGWSGELDNLGMDADLLLLQEAQMNEDLRDWLAEQAVSWDMSPAFKYLGTDTGVLTAARIPAQSPCGMRLEEPLTGIPKTTLLGYYSLENHQQSLLVINIHGVNFTANSYRLEKQLGDISQVIIAHKGPVILAGDFNTWSEDRWQLLASVTGELGLSPVSFAGEQPSARFGYALDHVFYRDLKPLRSEVIAVTASDHKALSVVFALED